MHISYAKTYPNSHSSKRLIYFGVCGAAGKRISCATPHDRQTGEQVDGPSLRLAASSLLHHVPFKSKEEGKTTRKETT